MVTRETNLNLLESRRRILLNTPHIESKSSLNPLSFSTDVVTDLKECKIHFSPVQEGSGTPSPENVREIKGWDGIEVTRCGDFIADIEWEQGAIDADINNIHYKYTSRKVNNATRIRCASLVSLDSTKTYKIVWNTDTYEIVTQPYGANGLSFKPESPHNIWQTEPYEFNSLHNVAIAIRRKDQANITPSEDVNANVKLLTNSDKISLSFPQTIYGGYVDLIKGEVVDEYQEVILDEATVLRSSERPDQNVATSRYIRITNCGKSASDATGYCESANVTIQTIWWMPTVNNIWTFCCNSDALHVCFSNDTLNILPEDGTTTRNEKISAWLAENNMRFIIPIATPITYPLTPQSLKSLRGLNNILTDANGNIDIKFYSH